MTAGNSTPNADDNLPNARSRYQVTREQLPLSCPLPKMALWCSHPKVYLPIQETGYAKCPYCGAEYVLID